MAFLSSMNIVASGMTAQQLRLDVVGENVTNSTTTRVENGEGAYRRKMVVFEAKTGRDGFRRAMARASTGMVPGGQTAGGVRVAQIVDDPSPMKLVYDPTHQRGRLCGNAQCGHGEGDCRRHGRHAGVYLERHHVQHDENRCYRRASDRKVT